jgi:hypothetical protein
MTSLRHENDELESKHRIVNAIFGHVYASDRILFQQGVNTFLTQDDTTLSNP